MEPTDNFAFLVPVMMASFGCIFLIMSRFRLPTSYAWGFAFLFDALGFVVPVVPMPITLNSLLADVLFFASFYYYGEALLIRFGLPLYARERLAFSGLCLAVDCYVVLGLASLRAELLLVDVSISLLLLAPWCLSVRRMRHGIDKLLVATSGLVIADTLIRIIVFTFVLPSSDQLESYESSAYSYSMQISAGVFTICFGMSALGSIVLETLGRYREAAERDPLTGLFNRRGFDAAMEALKPGIGGALFICDIDHFKQINDRYGHMSGDRVIAGLADLLRSDLPPQAISARFGGEEFVVFIPNISLADGSTFAQSIRIRLAAHDWNSIGIDRQITASFGLASFVPNEISLHDVVGKADRALYTAKAAGRNCVMLGEAAAGQQPGYAVLEHAALTIAS